MWRRKDRPITHVGREINAQSGIGGVRLVAVCVSLNVPANASHRQREDTGPQLDGDTQASLRSGQLPRRGTRSLVGDKLDLPWSRNAVIARWERSLEIPNVT